MVAFAVPSGALRCSPARSSLHRTRHPSPHARRINHGARLDRYVRNRMYENRRTAAPNASTNKIRTLPTALVLGCLALTVALAACRESAATPEGKAVQPTAGSPDSQAVLARIGDENITMTDVSARAGDRLAMLEAQYRLAKNRMIGAALDSLIRDRTVVAEAKKRGKSVDELVAAEAGPSGFDPSEG